MPILERDPWRLQYFENADCPGDVAIPTDDPDSWQLFPAHRWIYNKLLVAESQGLACGPHGVVPGHYPVFSKPVINLRGMGTGSRVINTAGELSLHQQPGHMWMENLTGEHVSTDCAVVNGAVKWIRNCAGVAGEGGTFSFWTVEASPRPGLEEVIAAWVMRHMGGYTGMMNFETIGGKIIEAHLRFADQWPDLYGAGWVDALVGLYRDGHWHFAESGRRTGYSVPLFVQHGKRHQHPSEKTRDSVLAISGVTSLQITFHEDRAPSGHAMPPGGFRLAIVNGTDLEACRAGRDLLRQEFLAQTT
jgi:hypothetical protein